ncbi:MAG: ABC transporter permease [Bdellovibrionota bacterium]
MSLGGFSAKYFALFRISAKDRISAPADVLARAFFFGAIIVVFSQLWKTLSASGGFLGSGASARDLVWYLFITESIILSLPPLPELVDQEIQTGNIAYDLIRPLDYVGARAVQFLGDVLARFLVNAVAGAIVAALLVGGPSHPGELAFALPLILGAFLIHLGICISISMVGFWVEDTLPFFWVYSKMSFVLGGLFMPIDYYPRWLQSLCRFFPMRDGVYSVAQVALGLHSSTHREVLGLMLRQVAWAGAGVSVAALLYTRGIRKLEARGG